MLKSSRQSEAPNPGKSPEELETIVRWLCELPREEVKELCEALSSRDAANLSSYLARFENYPKRSMSESQAHGPT